MNCLCALSAGMLLSSVCLPALCQLQNDRIATSAYHPVKAIQDLESPSQRDTRLQWWREARFGMFIHWGLYAVPAGTWKGQPTPRIGEWIMNDLSIPVADYKALAAQFNPIAFSAHEIVALAKSSGMRYIVITAKHHEGFAMYDSKADPFNIVAGTPYHRDPLKELAAEARKQGIKLGFYYSQDQDWTAPGGAAYKTTYGTGKHEPPTFHWDPAQNGDFATFLHTKAIPQLQELLTSYDPAIVWFDTPSPDMTPALAAEIVTLLNQHPNLIWNNRLGGGYAGDTETPEQYVPAQGFPGRDWEACMTMNDTWGYKANDTHFKSADELLRNLIDIASKGGNYLLNIGPDATGTVPSAEVERLHTMGKWLAVNGEAIYGTKPTLFGAEAGSFSSTEKDDRGNQKFISTWNWRSTTGPHTIYLVFFKWPGKTFHLDNSPRPITGAYLLADKTRTPLPINIEKQGKPGDADITLPAEPLDPVATVLVLTTK